MSYIKALAESPDLKFIPSNYAYCKNINDSAASDPQVSIPVIDFSLLTSGTPDQRIEVLQNLDQACKEWGFFTVVNHGIPETLMQAMIKVSGEFFNLPEEEKQRFQTKHVLDPISDLLLEYCQKTRAVARKLLQGISQSLGLEEGCLDNSLQLDSSLQIFIANHYPPCPQPDLAMGMPPHSDHGLLTLLIQNGVGGLQIQHNGKWVNVNALPNSILVNTGDHLEIFSNGRYKSVLHRAAVNDEKKRISIAVANGPSLDTFVSPASKLLQDETGCVPAYIPMKYREYLELQQGNILDGKSALDRVKIQI